MKYAKPEVVAVRPTIEVVSTIQLEKGPHIVIERQGPSYPLSAGAYEADE